MSVESAYTKTEIGEMPKEWKIFRLGDVTEVFGGATPSTDVTDYWNGAILFAILGIVGGSGIIANKVHCGLLMLIGGVGMLLTLAWFGALSAILFFLGGILILYGSSWMQGR